MANEKQGFINVDELMPQITIEQAVAFYGIETGELKRIGKEIRTRCFLNCGNTEETGDRAIAIDAVSPVKKWRCHQYGCGKGGNLIGLCDLMKPGEHSGGRPRGGRFLEIAKDLRAMVSGVDRAEDRPSPAESAPTTNATDPELRRNIPLGDSDNERVRAMVNHDEKFLTVPDENMNRHAASYMRARPYLTEEACRRWRCGYLPHDAGGMLRGKFVYPMISEDGKVLAWFGRDPQFEGKHEKWRTGGKRGREPNKFQFPSKFHRGLELFGQDRYFEHANGDQLEQVGIVVTEGPNDTIALWEKLSIASVAVCSNTITDEQVEKLVRMSRDKDGAMITLMFDADTEGERGAKEALWKIAERCQVRLGWSSGVLGGKFRNRQPDSLTADEWSELCSSRRDPRENA